MNTSSPDHAFLFPCIRNVALEAACRQLLSTCAATAGARTPGARARQREATALRGPPAAVKSNLHSLQLEEPEFSNKDPDEPKLNKQMNNTRNTATQKSQMLFHPTAAAAPVQRLSLETAPQQRYVSATCRLVCDLLGTSVLVYDYDSGDVAFNHLCLFSK